VAQISLAKSPLSFFRRDFHEPNRANENLQENRANTGISVFSCHKTKALFVIQITLAKSPLSFFRRGEGGEVYEIALYKNGFHNRKIIMFIKLV
jgi:hypothetical protein